MSAGSANSQHFNPTTSVCLQSWSRAYRNAKLAISASAVVMIIACTLLLIHGGLAGLSWPGG